MACILARRVTVTIWSRIRPRFGRTLVLSAACLLATGVFAAAGALAQVPPVGASAEVRDASGRLIATAEFREGRGEVLVTIIFPSPAALTGTHGLRIHEVGRCDPPDFLSAGNGFNPLNKKHGRQNPDGPQVGDLPNVNFTTGLTSYNTSAMGATLGAGATSLLGPNRSALIIYAGEDDQTTDPDGKAGARIACGVINAAPNAGVQPALSPGAPKPSPVPVQAAPPVVQPPPVQPAPAKPVVSPTPIQAQPVVPKPVVSAVPTPSPVVVAQQPLPTAPPNAVAAPQSSGGGLGTLPALIIAIVGVGLVGAGWLLRRRSQMSR
jgi:Cu-Zn family superoxide dismutase